MFSKKIVHQKFMNSVKVVDFKKDFLPKTSSCIAAGFKGTVAPV
jgi:hypothetical protein